MSRKKIIITAVVALLLYKSRWGLQVRAVVSNRTMSGAVGIDTRRVDWLTFGLGCGIAGIAAARTAIAPDDRCHA